MKKLLALTLSVVLVLSLTVVASAATFDPYIGGRITWAYKDGDQFEGDPVTLNNGGIKLLLRGRVTDEATGTWGAIGAKIDGWPDNDGSLGESKSIYDFGVNNIGGSNFSIWYSNWENENMNRGQGRIYEVTPAMYHEDMMFDIDMSNVIGIDYKSDNVIVNFGYVPDENECKKNDMQIAGTFKFDGGDVHFGYFDGLRGYDDVNYEATEALVGAAVKLGFGTIKVDYLTRDMNKDANDVDCAWEGGDIVQAAVFFDNLNFDVTLVSDNKYRFKNEGGKGYQIRYTGIDNVTFCYKAMEADEEVDEDLNFTDLYVGYKYGVLETRLGYGTEGEGDDNDFVYASVYVNFW